MGRRWKPSKAAAKKFAITMQEIDKFIEENGIKASASRDSYYFTVNGIDYRVSNHSVEASNAHAYNFMGEKVRDEYHPNGRREDVVYIHAGKARIMEIYTNLVNGVVLDGRGNPKA